MILYITLNMAVELRLLSDHITFNSSVNIVDSQHSWDRMVRATNSGNDSITSECIPTISDQQDYYKLTKTTGIIDSHWIELKDDSKHHGLSQSTGAHKKMNLNFSFPFYGHMIDQVYISTAGVVTMAEDNDHSQVSHYISPFLGHFDTSYSDNSAIYFEISDKKFIVEWRNVFLRAASRTGNIGPFQFQSIINRNGTILFLYKKVPRDAGLHSALMGLHSGIIITTTDAKVFVHYQGEELLKDETRSSMVVVFSPTPYARSFRRRFFPFHYTVNHSHINVILSRFSIPLVLKCAAKILKIGLQIQI